MAANSSKTSEDAEMGECDGQKVVTMMDVLQQQEDFEDDANAVLGASDDKNCTYSKGYVKRQAIYACLTCCPDATSDPMKRAGVCLACSLHCHENHELVELYTKRNFRCDCGNPKFTQPCTFTPNKTDLNYENKYNQNFSGLYCTCHRPYPDPEATEEEEMLQCIVCEDWLHTNHLEATVPLNDQYAEMVCKDCMEDNDFLHDYSDMIVNVVDKEIIVTDPDLDVTSIINKKKEEAKDISTNGSTESVINEIDAVLENKDKASTDAEMNVAKLGTSGDNNEDKKTDECNIDNKSEEKPTTEGDASETGENLSKADGAKPEENEEKPRPEEETLDSSEKKEANFEGNTETKTEETETKSNGNEAKSDETTEVIDKVEKAEDKPTEQPLENKEDISSTNTQENKRKLATEDEENISPKKQKMNPCTRPRGVKRVYKGATFWPSNLRQKLCSCSDCLDMYKDLAVLYLVDPDDTVNAYEALGKENSEGPSSQYEKGLQALSSLDRVQQINALTEYNRMRDKLLDFLKSFKDRKEIVKEEDIKAFFAGMKPKRETDGVYFCR